MDTVEKVDCALLPPCSKTLHNKIKRTNYVALLWGRADSSHPGDGLDPLDFGWAEKDGCFVPEWFSGPSIPDIVFEGQNPADYVDQSADRATGYDESVSEPSWSDDSDVELEV